MIGKNYFSLAPLQCLSDFVSVTFSKPRFRKYCTEKKNQMYILALLVNQRENNKNSKAKGVLILVLRMYGVCTGASWQGGDGDCEGRDREQSFVSVNSLTLSPRFTQVLIFKDLLCPTLSPHNQRQQWLLMQNMRQVPGNNYSIFNCF